MLVLIKIIIISFRCFKCFRPAVRLTQVGRVFARVGASLVAIGGFQLPRVKVRVESKAEAQVILVVLVQLVAMVQGLVQVLVEQIQVLLPQQQQTQHVLAQTTARAYFEVVFLEEEAIQYWD